MSTTVLYPEEKEKIIVIENHKKQKLFIKANDWMVETFNNA
jgi:hypothetical protein